MRWLATASRRDTGEAWGVGGTTGWQRALGSGWEATADDVVDGMAGGVGPQGDAEVATGGGIRTVGGDGDGN